MNKKNNVIVIGGGTGTFAILSGLKKYKINLNAIITAMDSGGSTGKLRDQYGVLPPGDIRQALVALSQSHKIWRQLFLYRFDQGDFYGHNFGNLFLTALEKVTGNFQLGLKLAEQILRTKGKVIPITLEKTHINCLLENKEIIRTEALIDERTIRYPIKKLFLQKQVSVNPKAVEALKKADLIIVGPGDVFTSVLPNFLFPEFVSAYKNSSAKKIFILNLMNKLGQTDNFTATKYLSTYAKYLGEKPFDSILINNREIPKKILAIYTKSGDNKITDDLKETDGYTIYRDDFLNLKPIKKISSDKINRSLIRHDSKKIGQVIYSKIIIK